MTATASDLEIHQLVAELHFDPETRSAGGELKVSGYASVFNSENADSEARGFVEVVKPGAFKRALARADADPFLNWMHDSSKPLARASAGNLTLSEDAKGLRFSATLPPTSIATDALTLIRAGVVRHASIEFSLTDDGQTIEKRDGKVYRTIHSIDRLYGMGLVGEPAFTTTSVEPRSVVRDAIRRERIRLTEREVYGPGSEHSQFRDMARDEIAKEQRRALRGTSNVLENWSPPEWLELQRNGKDGTIDDARKRLATVEQRAVSSGDPWAPSSTGAGYVTGVFATAVRARAVLATALRQEPLDRKGMTVSLPRLTTGALAASSAADNSAVTTQDPVSALASSPVVTIDGEVDASQQLADQTPGGDFDQAVAQDLGLALGLVLETQVINGSGAGGQLAGLLGRAGAASVTVTATTLAGQWSAICNIDQTVQTALGEPANLMVFHPRRLEYIRALTLQGALPWDDDLTVLESVAMPINLGAGTNEDRILNVASTYAVLFSRPPTISVLSEVLSGSLSVRFQAHQYVALVVRKPQAIGVVSSTGLVTPVFP